MSRKPWNSSLLTWKSWDETIPTGRDNFRIDHAEAIGAGSGPFAAERYPNFVAIARGYGWSATTVEQKADLAGAIREMIDAKGPYLLDVAVPYQAHVLPMIPSGGTVHELIKE